MSEYIKHLCKHDSSIITTDSKFFVYKKTLQLCTHRLQIS